MGVPSIPEQREFARQHCPALLAQLKQYKDEAKEEAVLQARREILSEILEEWRDQLNGETC